MGEQTIVITSIEMIRKKVEIEEDFRYAGLGIGVYFSRRMMLGDKY